MYYSLCMSEVSWMPAYHDDVSAILFRNISINIPCFPVDITVTNISGRPAEKAVAIRILKNVIM